MGRAAHEDMEEAEEELQADFQVLVRDIYAFYPLLIKYVDLHRSHWLKHPRIGAVQLFTHVAEVFTVWHTSQHFRREEQKFVSANAINNMALIMPTSSDGAQAVETPAWKKSKRNRGKSMKDATQSLNVACLKRMLPIGLTLFGGREQELVQHAKQKLLAKENEEVVEEYVRNALIDSNTMADPFDRNHWQRVLYNKIGSKTVVGIEDVQQDSNITVSKIMFTAKTLEMLHIVLSGLSSTVSVWQRLLSNQRRLKILECLKLSHHLHSLPRHRAINLFLLNYIDKWLSLDACGQEVLVKNITNMMAAYQSRPNEKEEEEGVKPDPLNQLVICFSRHATTEQNALPDDFLYIAYTELMSKSCGGEEDDDGDGEDEEEEDDGPGNTLQEQEMGKQKLLFEQGRLADRYVAEMVLLSISACRGEQSNMMLSNLQLGISCLMDGNINVQKKMLQHLQDKKDSDFFTSLSALMDKCSVLDLDAFERNIKAEKLGVGPESAGEQNMHDYLFTCKLFRFLQLLCEGHNLDFQNYLRTQTGNTVSVNLVICIVDYMLRLQESVMDFYWHYSSKEVIDQQGKENFKKAIKVGEQVFNTLTEAIQGPCVLNQMALAHSRLWDAVGGFFFLFAHMQNKLAKNTSQLDLMTQIMQFQNDMVTMMISMLEGNVMNGTIGKQMVDTLMESKANVEMILKFFDMFLKLKNIIESPSFLEYTKEGFISPKDFIRAMEAQKIYSPEEIMYLTECAGPRNAEGHIDYNEFCNRFHTPANDIGFNLAVLLTNLSEHMPNDPRLSRFCENASSFLEYFEPTLGRIEILGGAGRIERVYFEINPDHKDQWEKPQIKESKRSFLHNVVNEGGEKEKLDMFVNFCEDSIFEMQHASSISPQEEEQKPVAPTDRVGIIRSSVIEPTKAFFGAIYMFVASCLYLCRWSNIRKHYQKMRKMSKYELCVGTLRLSWAVIVRTCWITYFIITTLYQFVMLMMRGPKAKDLKPVDTKRRHGHHRHVLSTDLFLDDFSGPQSVSAFGVAIKTETSEAVTATQMYSDDGAVDDIDRMVEMNGDVRRSFDGGLDVPKPMQRDGSTWTLTAESSDIPIEGLAPPRTKESLNATSDESVYGDKESSSAQARRGTEEDEEEEGKEGTDYHKAALSFLARNFYTLKTLALVLAFCINFILLFYKVTVLEIEEGEGEEGEEEAKAPEWVHLEEDHSAILDPTIRLLAFIHSAVAFSMLIAYYYLKVPLFIFKREKEVCRSLLFDGLYVAEQPSEDDIKAHWDKLVISTRSFPENYWDKFIKKSVQQKYSEQYDHDAISLLLGMDEADSFSTENPKKKESGGLISFIYSIDWKYQIWKSGVILTNNSFLYIMWYFLFSVLGNFNYFFFASHLLDVVMSIKALSTIMQSITHNGKQLCLTLMMMTIIVYIYTVLAFNFFRKFYVSEGDDGEEEHKCHTMAACFLFHLYVGVRAGGGIGDEIEAPDGDQQMFRFVFDITFFFFVIVILLAIIQGLIIDAFGELRGQLEQVKEDMESQCFICGIGKEYFDKIPHGFDTHVLKEHDLANYLFFLMYLIDKPETDYTGQETYVWELYQKRSWDFFPVGDCFRKQYENEIMAG
ncbi:PREDICTED: ryanodine receptor-like isoform X2 [Priapulus caudatus]|uniref:Ryanodine receptor-like isoform X2 n=1 Tax=Priapulus caudatus TaxID=37621 RepID=A0ABM1DXK8_PRICU|nr:PREDICTED: ryanodine receptor-like isoform X2 [Priapulus caudatus]